MVTSSHTFIHTDIYKDFLMLLHKVLSKDDIST